MNPLRVICRVDGINARMKGDALQVGICGEDFLLHPDRAVFWIRKRILLISDVHLAKSGHFRKAGISIPSSVHEDDLRRLSLLMEKLQPESLCILGDLFHSRQNMEWKSFEQWRKKHGSVSITLVRGNHDVHDDSVMKDHGLDHVYDSLTEPPFFFSHVPSSTASGGLHNMAGHLHPAVVMSGKGRQSGVFPCFWVSEHFSVLPAFGNFTGKAIIQPRPGDRVYITCDSRVMAVSLSES